MNEIPISEQDMLERAAAIRQFASDDTRLLEDVTVGFSGHRIPIVLQFGDEIAQTDGDRIAISLPVGMLGIDIDTAPKIVKNTLRSLIYHEVAHCLWSDFSGGEYSDNQHPKTAITAVHPFLPLALNAFEDVRVDRDMEQELPAYAEVNAVCARHSLAEHPDASVGMRPEMQVLLAASFSSCRIPDSVIYKQFPAAGQYRELVDDILQANTQSTSDAYAATLDWYKKAKVAGLLKDTAEPKPDSEGQDQSGSNLLNEEPGNVENSDNESGEGDGESTSNGTADVNDGQNSGQTSANSNNGNSGQGSANGDVTQNSTHESPESETGNQDSSADNDEIGEPSDTQPEPDYSNAQDLRDMLKDALTENVPQDVRDALDDRMQDSTNMLSEAINNPTSCEGYALRGMASITYQTERSRSLTEADRDKRMKAVQNIDTRTLLEVRKIFHANARQGYSSGFTTGKRIKPRNMVHAVTGTSNAPFVRRDSITKKSYVVALVVDASGSMTGGSIETAMTSALLITDLLNSVGVKVRITKYSSYMSTYITRIKEFDEPLTRDMRDHILGCTDVGVGTPTYFAVHEAVKALRQRPENTKLLIDLSDGAPGAHGDFQKHALRSLIAETPGISFGQLGILTDPFVEAYNTTRHIMKLGELPAAIISLLKEMLEK